MENGATHSALIMINARQAPVGVGVLFIVIHNESKCPFRFVKLAQVEMAFPYDDRCLKEQRPLIANLEEFAQRLGEHGGCYLRLVRLGVRLALEKHLLTAQQTGLVPVAVGFQDQGDLLGPAGVALVQGLLPAEQAILRIVMVVPAGRAPRVNHSRLRLSEG